MKIAVFSDVHGNYLNLVSFFESADKLNIDKFICLGDLCNYYSDNLKVIDLIKKRKINCLLGNHDELYIKDTRISEKKKSDYNFDISLLESKEHVNFLKTLPLKFEITENNISILFCHASPNDFLYTYIYPDTDLSQFNNIKHNIVFVGHSHRQFLRQEGDKMFCNVGSIGLPRDNGSLMGFAIFDTDDLSITLYRKKIDIDGVIERYENKINIDLIELLNRKETINYKYTLINE